MGKLDRMEEKMEKLNKLDDLRDTMEELLYVAGLKEEWDLQQRAKKAEQARKELEYQSKILFVKNDPQEASEVQESGTSCLDYTNEYIKEQEASDCPEKSKSCSTSSQECTEIKETESKVAVGITEDAMEETRNARLSSPLPSSPEVMVQETLSQVYAVPLLLSLQVERDRCDLAKKTNARVEWHDLQCNHGSRETVCEGAVRQLVKISESATLDVDCTWMKKTVFEKSNLVPTISDYQRYFLDPFEYMGFLFQENDPKFLMPLATFRRPTNVFLDRALITQGLPSHLFILMWYKGKLIKMLLGSAVLQDPVDNSLGAISMKPTNLPLNWILPMQLSPTHI